MSRYTEERLRDSVAKSKCFSDLLRLLGYSISTNIRKKVTRDLVAWNIDFSHFDSRSHAKERRKYEIVEKVCPVCRRTFLNINGGNNSKVCCSHLCANRNVPKETIELRNKRLREAAALRTLANPKPSRPQHYRPQRKRDPTDLDRPSKLWAGFIGPRPQQKGVVRRACDCCDGPTNKSGSKYCSIECASKHKGIRILAGTLKGWETRGKLSYPEKFFKKVLELNGLDGEFELNAPVAKRSLGIDCATNYFLDFYFPALKLDLEIDGKQHKEADRLAHDKGRDAALKKAGFHVYRIPWVGINRATGKAKIKAEIESLLLYIHNLKKCKVEF